MNNTLKSFIFSIIIHLLLAAPFIYIYGNIEKKREIKTVSIDLNMINTLPIKETVEKKTPPLLKKEKRAKPLEKKKIKKEIVKKTIKPEKEKKVVKKIKPKKIEKKSIVKKEPLKKPAAKPKPERVEKKHTKTEEKIIEKEKIVKKTEDKKVEKIAEKVFKKKPENKSLKEEKKDENYVKTYMNENLSYIVKAIKKYKRYPYSAKRKGFEGKSILSCIFTKNGELKDIEIKTSSGYKMLDSNSIEILKQASREFKKPSRDITLYIPFNYYLD